MSTSSSSSSSSSSRTPSSPSPSTSVTAMGFDNSVEFLMDSTSASSDIGSRCSIVAVEFFSTMIVADAAFVSECVSFPSSAVTLSSVAADGNGGGTTTTTTLVRSATVVVGSFPWGCSISSSTSSSVTSFVVVIAVRAVIGAALIEVVVGVKVAVVVAVVVGVAMHGEITEASPSRLRGRRSVAAGVTTTIEADSVSSPLDASAVFLLLLLLLLRGRCRNCSLGRTTSVLYPSAASSSSADSSFFPKTLPFPFPFFVFRSAPSAPKASEFKRRVKASKLQWTLFFPSM
mmetsp:Transcript_22438/g.47204  ORF Transcript_22438/g.47204 Transcript_22438/m.47204 type:complete len:288 (+) Transcript_22438:603-1466(+)